MLNRIIITTVTIFCSIQHLFARAGSSGRGIGGGSYGGGYRGGYYGRSYIYSEYTDTPEKIAFFTSLPFILAILGFFIYYFIRKSRVSKALKKAETLLLQAHKEDSFWHPQHMKSTAKTMYIDMQKAWMNNDLLSLKGRITENIIKKYQQKLRYYEKMGVRNFMDKIKIERIQIIGVTDMKDNNKDSFSIFIEGTMIDILTPKNAKPKNKIEHSIFKDIYEFVRINDQWVLNKIRPVDYFYKGFVTKNMKE